jgi:hypothetical protein
MSRDQKPGRMRVVGGNAPPPVAAPQDAADGSAAGAATAPAATPDAGPSLLLPVLLFLIASAIGGSGVVLLRLLP